MKLYYALLGGLILGICYLSTLGGSAFVSYKNLAVAQERQQDEHVTALYRGNPNIRDAMHKNERANWICEHQGTHALLTVWKRDRGVPLETALDDLKDPYQTWQREKTRWWASFNPPLEPSAYDMVRFRTDRQTILMVYHLKTEWGESAAPIGAKLDCFYHLNAIISQL